MRRRSYATLLVDQETHRPVDLLQERTAEVLAAWLKAHPGVEVVVRDRSEAYIEGIRMGAPGAIQVADRFHLLQNASVALEVHCLNALDTRSYALAICSLDRLKSMKHKHGTQTFKGWW
jgi:transposase